MALTKVTYVPRVTAVSGDNLNDIQDELIDHCITDEAKPWPQASQQQVRENIGVGNVGTLGYTEETLGQLQLNNGTYDVYPVLKYSEAELYIPTTQSGASVTAKSIRQWGRLVEIYFSASSLVLTARQWNNIATILQAYQPGRAIDFFAVDNANGIPVQTRITYVGNINVWPTEATEQIRFCITYIL